MYDNGESLYEISFMIDIINQHNFEGSIKRTILWIWVMFII